MAAEKRERVTADDVARRSAVESGGAPIGLRRLWLGLLLAPGVWLVSELAGYYFSARSCELGHAGVPFYGTDHPAITHVVLEMVFAVVAAVGVLVAVRNWRETLHESRPGESPAPGRAHFMAFTGVLVSSIFLFGIVLFAFSGFVVNACSQAR